MIYMKISLLCLLHYTWILCRRHRLLTKVKHYVLGVCLGRVWIFLGSNTAVFQWHEKASWYYNIIRSTTQQPIPEITTYTTRSIQPSLYCECDIRRCMQRVLQHRIQMRCPQWRYSCVKKNELRKKDDVKNILLSWAIIRFFKSPPARWLYNVCCV